VIDWAFNRSPTAGYNWQLLSTSTVADFLTPTVCSCRRLVPVGYGSLHNFLS